MQSRALDPGHSLSDDTEARRRPAPGKQTRTAGLQRKARSSAAAPAAAAPSPAPAADPYDFSFCQPTGGGALPHAETIGRSFGPAHEIAGIVAHTGGEAATACDHLGAEAYALGAHVGFRSAPDLHTAAHEAAHVVQQRAGVQLYGGIGEVGDRYEQHADAVADRVVAGQSAADLLDGLPTAGGRSALQRKVLDGGGGDYPGFHAALAETTRRYIEQQVSGHDEIAESTWGRLEQATGKPRAWLEGYVDWLERNGNAAARTTVPLVNVAKNQNKMPRRGDTRATKLDVDELGGMVAMQQTLAQTLDFMVPGDGGKVELETKVGISVEGVYGAITLKLEAERNDDGFEVAGGVEFLLGLGVPDDYIAITGSTGIEGKGDDAFEAVNLAGFALDRSIRPLGSLIDGSLLRELATKGIAGTLVSRTIGNTIANFLWGKTYADVMAANLDDNDEARRNNSIGLEGKADLEVAKGKVSGEYQSDDVWKANTEGGIEHSVEDQLAFEIGLKLDMGPAGAFELKASAEVPSTKEITIKLELGIGLKDGLSQTSPKAVAAGARTIIEGLTSYSKQLGKSRFARIVDSVCETLDQALQKVDAALGTWLSVEAEYNSATGELKITVYSATKVDKELDGGEVKVEISGSRSVRLLERTFEVRIPTDG